MSRLIAQIYLVLGNREFHPGDELPTDDVSKADALVENGAAAWCGDAPPVRVAAIPATAQPGMTGRAVGGEVTGNDLVGRVPDTPERRRPRRNPKT